MVLSIALSLSNKILEDTATFSICRIELVAVGEPFTYTGRVEYPTSTTFKYESKA